MAHVEVSKEYEPPPPPRTRATECDGFKRFAGWMRRCRMVYSRSTSSSSPTADTLAPLELDQNAPPDQLSLLSFPPRLLRHGLSVFHSHSLTPRSLHYHPPPLVPPPGCRVSLASCHTGPPTLTHGGREGERNRTPTCCRRSSMIVEDYF